MLNKVILMGRLTATPEIKYTPNNVPVTSFTIAVNRRFTSRGGEQQTDFIDVVCWRNTAEFVCKYFTKGQLMALSGTLQTRMWRDKNDNSRKSVEVIADEVYFAEPKRNSSSPFPSDDIAPALPDDAFSVGSPDDFSEIDDDDLPF